MYQILTLFAAMFLTGVTSAQLPYWYACEHTGNPPVIDGDINDSVWLATPWTSSFIDIRDTTYPAPEFETAVKMRWDTNFLYMAAWLEEPHIRAKLKQRDTVIFYDNDFEFFVDPDGDHHDYGEFEVNARGTSWDLLITEPYQNRDRALVAWDIRDLQMAIGLYGTLNDPSDIDSGWTVELAIPMKDLKEMRGLKEPPFDGEYWKVNFSRVDWPLEIVGEGYTGPATKDDWGKESNWVWSPQGDINMHLPEEWGILLFCEGNPPSALPDTIHEREMIRSEMMRLYHFLDNYYEVRGTYPSEVRSQIARLGFRYITPGTLQYQKTALGFELTLPYGDNRAIRLTDNRQFVIHELDP